jgi:DNA-binding MarR family transcriptional regulator
MDDLARALRRLSRATERLETAATAAAGLSRAQAHALLAVASMARPSMVMVARELDLAPSTVTRLLDPLVRRGMMRREADSKDRRVIMLVLTGTGKQAATRLAADLERRYVRVAAATGAGGRRRLLAAARELVDAIERLRPVDPPKKSAGAARRPPGKARPRAGS